MEKIIITYLVDTEDFDLTFGEKPVKSVDELIVNLEKLEFLNAEDYKPIRHRFFGLNKVELGWKIAIKINEKEYKVTVTTSEKDELIIMD